MSIKAEYRDGAFTPLEEVESAAPDEVYQVFSESELRRFAADVQWLKGDVQWLKGSERTDLIVTLPSG